MSPPSCIADTRAIFSQAGNIPALNMLSLIPEKKKIITAMAFRCLILNSSSPHAPLFFNELITLKISASLLGDKNIDPGKVPVRAKLKAFFLH